MRDPGPITNAYSLSGGWAQYCNGPRARDRDDLPHSVQDGRSTSRFDAGGRARYLAASLVNYLV